MTNLKEETIQYINSLSPEDREAIYRRLQGKPPLETLESLTEKLTELSKKPGQKRAERRQISAAIDKKLRMKAEIKLDLFINDELDKGGALNTRAIKAKAKELGLEYEDIIPHIHLTQQLRRISRGGE
jgi:hypothetical protein